MDLVSKADTVKQQNMSKSEVSKDSEIKENINSEESTMNDSDSSDKGKTLPEPIRVGKDPSKLPSIGLAELTTILQGPNMPSKKLMKEVTEKLRMKNDESGSDDGSVSSGGVVAMRGILDCILEASLYHQDSEDESDIEGDEIFVRELPCKFCKKVFSSTMKLKTHVLMTHSQEDPSVLNVKHGKDGKREKRLSGNKCRTVDGKDVLTRGHKRSSAGASETNLVTEREKSIRSRHSSKEQKSKLIEEKKKPDNSSCPSQTLESNSSTTTLISSPATREASSDDKADLDCDCQSTDANPSNTFEQSTVSPLEAAPSKVSKRKPSGDPSSDSNLSSTKKAKLSRSQSIESDKKNIPLRRSLRKK